MSYLSVLSDCSVGKVFAPHFCFHLMAFGCQQQLELLFFLLSVQGVPSLKEDMHRPQAVLATLSLGRAGGLGPCVLPWPRAQAMTQDLPNPEVYLPLLRVG